MKPLILATLLLFTLVGFAQSAEDSYVASLSGIECADCKKTIARSLGRLKGVKTIRIVKTGENRHRLTVVTDGSKNLTIADAKKALKSASHYKILSWTKTG